MQVVVAAAASKDSQRQMASRAGLKYERATAVMVEKGEVEVRVARAIAAKAVKEKEAVVARAPREKAAEKGKAKDPVVKARTQFNGMFFSKNLGKAACALAWCLRRP